MSINVLKIAKKYIVHVSNTNGKSIKNLPKGDILVVSGNFTKKGTEQ